MFEVLQSGPATLCNWLISWGVSCSATVVSVNVWQTIAALIVFLVVWATVRPFVRHRHLDRYQQLLSRTAPYKSCDSPRTIRLHPYAMADAMDEKGYRQLTKTAAGVKLNDKYNQRYFVVEVREGGRRLLRKELKIYAWPYNNMSESEFQVDAETLRALKDGSQSKLDDETGNSVGADGSFDIFFRIVRWWDVRHWLNHPSREIRYALYVAIFAASLEYSADIFEFLRAVFRTPNI
ncbi:MAG: hypothetical protein AAGA72_18695 [Pseudomonadota bacterium]